MQLTRFHIRSKGIPKALLLRGGESGIGEVSSSVFENAAAVINASGGTILVVVCIAAMIDLINLLLHSLMGKGIYRITSTFL